MINGIKAAELNSRVKVHTTSVTGGVASGVQNIVAISFNLNLATSDNVSFYSLFSRLPVFYRYSLWRLSLYRIVLLANHDSVTP